MATIVVSRLVLSEDYTALIEVLVSLICIGDITILNIIQV